MLIWLHYFVEEVYNMGGFIRFPVINYQLALKYKSLEKAVYSYKFPV